MKRTFLFGAIAALALVSFEVFNFNATKYALSDLLSAMGQTGLSWALILTIAFCAIDISALAWLMPALGEKDSKNWLLIWAWLLGVCLNAVVIGWGFYTALVVFHSTPTATAVVIAVILAFITTAIRILVVNSPLLFLRSN